jgi:serine phosphatase RsbU (regulator of sigma subunit)/uncharacterized membrane protein affecting hemolysin expression
MLKNLSIRRKVITVILLVTITSLLIASTILYTYNVNRAKKSMVEDLTMLSELTGRNNQAALFFNDAQSAQDNLNAFSTIENIDIAAIYNSDQELFASFCRDDFKAIKKLKGNNNYYNFTEDHVELLRKIVVEEDHLYIYILSSLDQFNAQTTAFLIVIALVILGALIYAIITTLILEKPITLPIRSMAGLMNEISEHKDYSVRMDGNYGKHELGLLTNGFNEMLQQIETQNSSIMQSVAEITEQNHQIEQQSVKIENQRKELQATNDILVGQNKEITDSLQYAQRIQRSILPPKSYINNLFPDNFVLYRPKDFVSGDFYWFNHTENKKFFVAADCTGHGVPGTLLSILGSSMMNQIVIENNITKPSEVLDYLDKGFLQAFHTEKGSEHRDGMDIAFCAYDERSGILEYAGAVNPLYYVRNGEMNVIKGDRCSIVSKIEKGDKSYTNHSIKVEKGDIFYIFSDGYADQIGGPKEKKIMIKNFRERLLANSQLPLIEQKELLESYFNEWKKNIFQVDDVIVIGIKI